jgi:hypothetical protein
MFTTISVMNDMSGRERSDWVESRETLIRLIALNWIVKGFDINDWQGIRIQLKDQQLGENTKKIERTINRSGDVARLFIDSNRLSRGPLDDGLRLINNISNSTTNNESSLNAFCKHFYQMPTMIWGLAELVGQKTV